MKFLNRAAVRIISVFIVSVLAQSAWAATIELVPMVGFGFNGSKDLAGPQDDRLSFQNKPLTGISLGYLLADDGEVELLWNHSNTAAYIDQADHAPAQRLDVKMDQFYFNCIHMTSPAPIQPFVLIGFGATRYAPPSEYSTTMHFSMAIGGGIKLLLTDHIGLRLDARWTPVLATPGTHFFCEKDGSGECFSTESNSYLSRTLPFLNNFDVTSGLMLRY